MLPLRIEVGDQVRLRKAHACGADVWEVVRTGADIKAKCLQCGRVVFFPRVKLERRIKEFVARART
ncbi:MAG: DUF951 domain-containing protein [Armatimonadota bacterium]